MTRTVERVGSHQWFDMALVSKSWICLEAPVALIQELQGRSSPSLSHAGGFLSASCFWSSKNALFVFFTKFICSLCLFTCDSTSWFKLPARCDMAWVWERTTSLFWWGFTTSFFLGADSRTVCQAQVRWFPHQCLLPRHQNCCNHQQSHNDNFLVHMTYFLYTTLFWSVFNFMPFFLQGVIFHF